MTPLELRLRLAKLPEHLPLETELSHALKEGAGYNNAWYRSQKEHWQGWLLEYSGPGAYGRKTETPRNAQLIWGRIQCAPMLLWLAEAVEIPSYLLKNAFEDVLSAPKRNSSQCRALREVIAWQAVEELLPAKPNLFQRLRYSLSAKDGEC